MTYQGISILSPERKDGVTNETNSKDYCNGINDGAEIFKNFMHDLLNMDIKDRHWIFGNLSVADILRNHTADEIMARMGAAE